MSRHCFVLRRTYVFAVVVGRIKVSIAGYRASSPLLYSHVLGHHYPRRRGEENDRMNMIVP